MGGRVIFFDIFDHPPTSLKSPKKWVSSGGRLGGEGSGDKPTIQPLEVWYANSPKKAPKGGYVAFSQIYRPAWL